MNRNWLKDGIAKAVATMKSVGLSEAPLLSLPPLAPGSMEIETVHQPGEYTFKFAVPVDPMLNVHRLPASFALLAKRSDQSSFATVATAAASSASIRGDTSGMGAGLWSYVIRAINPNGVADSVPYQIAW